MLKFVLSIFCLIQLIDSKNSYDEFIDEIITKGVADLGISLHNSHKNDNTDHLVYSPVSIATALYLLLLGSNGQSFSELSEILGISHGVNVKNNSLKVHHEFGDILHELETQTDECEVKFANGLFVQNNFPLREQYVQVSNLVYDTETQNLDFKGDPMNAQNVINNWSKNKTRGKIGDILNELPSPETRVVVASTLYFKAEWNTTFNSDLNTIQTFYPDGLGTQSQIKYTQLAQKNILPYYNSSNCQILGLPYKNTDYTFYILLPHNSNKNTLRNFVKGLTFEEIKQLVEKTFPTEILAAIPKMKLTSSIELRDLLQDNGLKSIFSPRESDLGLLTDFPIFGDIEDEEPLIFSRMKDGDSRKKRQLPKGIISNNRNFDRLRLKLPNSNSGVYVNKILHKVQIDVNEKGTEAAATTSAFLGKSNVLLFKANTPFLFFIHHKSNLILFWGIVNKPPFFQTYS